MKAEPKCRRCGHDKDAHRHYSGPAIRPTWCGLCECRKYWRGWLWIRHRKIQLQIVRDR